MRIFFTLNMSEWLIFNDFFWFGDWKIIFVVRRSEQLGFHDIPWMVYNRISSADRYSPEGQIRFSFWKVVVVISSLRNLGKKSRWKVLSCSLYFYLKLLFKKNDTLCVLASASPWNGPSRRFLVSWLKNWYNGNARVWRDSIILLLQIIGKILGNRKLET